MAYRAALIGCGHIGSLYADDPLIKGIYTHAGAYAACQKTELIAVCDLDPLKATKCGSKWQVPTIYSNVQKLLLEQKPDIVSICTPDHTHSEILHLVLQTPSVRAILMEKPLALQLGDAENLVKLAKEKGIILVVNYSRRYSHGHEKIKRLIEAGDLGKIQKVSGFYTKGILHNGTHWIDLARWLIGQITAVQGFNTQKEKVTDPTLDAFFIFEQGTTGFLQGLDASIFSLFEMDIIGTQGRIRLIDSGHVIEYFHLTDSPYYSGYKTLQKEHEKNGELNDTLLNALNDLIACLETKKQATCSGEDGLTALHIAESLIRSATSKRLIHLSKENT